MLYQQIRKQWYRHLCAALGIIVFLLVVACGRTTATPGSAGPVASGTSTAITSGTPPPTISPGSTGTPTSDTMTGCPAATQSTPWPTPPDAVIAPQSGSRSGTITVGQTIEVRLPFGFRWGLLPNSYSPALTLETPAGYGDAKLKSCVWRFAAQQAGQASLDYSEMPLCLPNTRCSDVAIAVTFDVTINAK